MVDFIQDRRPKEELNVKPTPRQRMDEAVKYLNDSWPGTFSYMKKHDPDKGGSYYNMTANVAKSPVLQNSIDEMAEGYRKALLEKAEIKFDAHLLEKQRPGIFKRLLSSEAKGKLIEINKQMEPVEERFVHAQIDLSVMNVKYYERLTKEVEASYDGATREKLGDKVGEQARIDAYTMLGKMIQYTVERFNEAFRRSGIDEFGVPKNIEDPRPPQR